MTVCDTRNVKCARKHGTSAERRRSQSTATSARSAGHGTKWLVRVLLAVALYLWARSMAQAARGYNAVGGELLILGLPWYIEAIGRTVKDWIREIREGLHADD